VADEFAFQTGRAITTDIKLKYLMIVAAKRMPGKLMRKPKRKAKVFHSRALSDWAWP